VTREKTCALCGKTFTAKRPHGEFCSDTCRVKYHRWLEKDSRPRRDCLQCGTPLDGKRSDAKYCGQECRTKAWTEEQLRKDPLWGIGMFPP
jgi:predicted nucleic acid-binding Zn ribbon protein